MIHTNTKFERFSYIRKERVVNHTMYKNFINSFYPDNTWDSDKEVQEEGETSLRSGWI